MGAGAVGWDETVREDDERWQVEGRTGEKMGVAATLASQATRAERAALAGPERLQASLNQPPRARMDWG